MSKPLGAPGFHLNMGTVLAHARLGRESLTRAQRLKPGTARDSAAEELEMLRVQQGVHGDA